MDFEYSAKVKTLQTRLRAFMDEYVYPNEQRYHERSQAGDRWQPTPLVEELKPKARAAGLWNLFLPESATTGAGLTNLEYAPLCEIMGRVHWSPEVFNCSAPDTGNMEMLERYGTPEQKERVARAAARRRDPLLLRDDRAGRGLVATPPTSRPHRARRRRVRHQRPQVVDLRRRRPALQDLHLHGQDRSGRRRTAPAAVDDARARATRPASRIVRRCRCSATTMRRTGTCEVVFENVRVPASNMLLGEGRGFEIAQGRLGPGRIHHCMRADRPGRARARDDVPARQAARRVRQAARASSR